MLLNSPARPSQYLWLPSQLGKPGQKQSLLMKVFRRLVGGQEEQRGLGPLQELARQSSEDENRLKKLIQQESKLDELQRDVIADEAVFSSTLGKLNVIRSITSVLILIFKSSQSLPYPCFPVRLERSLFC